MRELRPLPRFLAAAAFLLSAVPALAQTAPAEQWQRRNLLGDIGGLRTILAEYGARLDLSETSEVFGNLTGGVHRGFEYAGLTRMALTLDTAKAFGWSGGTFYARALQIHGRNLSADNLAVLQTISNIDADRSTRLWDLWYEQKLPRLNLDFTIGQENVDHDFIVSKYAGLFIDAMNGWPALPSNDLYAGGPVYPLSSPGVLLKGKPAKALTVLAGVFDDNPPGGPFFDDSQLRDGEASGTRFNLGTGALILAEVQYHGKILPFTGASLPGTYKLGAWIDTGRFPDQRFDTSGLSLAAPGSTGVPRFHHGDFSIYGVIDQKVWRSLGAFLRVMGAPADRNLVDWSLNAGLDLKAPLPGRKDDSFGIAYGWAHVSGQASALDRDVAIFTGRSFPIRSAEHIVEITYVYSLAPWWQLQPDLQYVVNPGGGIPNPQDPPQRIGNELVVGLRTTLTF